MKKDFFCASEFIVIGNEMWYVPLGYRYLCCYDLEYKKMKEKFLIPQNRKQIGLYESINFYKDDIIFIPYVADYFLIFHLKERTFEMVAIESYKIRGIEFYANFIYKNFLYFFPRAREEFAKDDCLVGRLDLETKQIEYSSIREKKQLETESAIECLFRREILVVDKEVFLLDGNQGVLKVSFAEDHLIQNVNRLCKNKKFSTIRRINEEIICMTDDDGNVFCCDLNGKIVRTIENTVEDFVSIRNDFWYSECFSYSVQYKDIIYLFPSEANKVLQFNVNEMTISEAVFSPQICVAYEKDRYSCGQFSKPYIVGNTLYVWNLWNARFYMINLSTNEVEEILIEVTIPAEELIKSYFDWSNEGEFVKECSLLYTGVESMINCLSAERGKKQFCEDKLVGREIWHKVRG